MHRLGFIKVSNSNHFRAHSEEERELTDLWKCLINQSNLPNPPLVKFQTLFIAVAALLNI
jgi:hypothetical protein